MHTHSDRLERWLGAAAVKQISDATRDWYGPPIPMGDVPGRVYAVRGGDFIGDIDAGQEMSSHDRLAEIIKRERRRRIAAVARSKRQLGAFGSIDAIMAAATAGKYQDLKWAKTGVASNAIGNALDLWTRAGYPAAGAAGGASPGGTNFSSADAGSIPFTNPATTNSLQPTSGWSHASVAPNSLLLYDRLHGVVKTMNSTATQAVNGVPTRYQSAVSGNVQSAEGNFFFPANPTTVLAATGHNWTVCQYTNSAGTAARSAPSTAGISACVVGGIDLVAGRWFMPLQAGDLGVKLMTQLQADALVATGTIDFVLAHALCYFSCPIASIACKEDFVFTAFRATKILDSACLTFLELPKPATTATNYNGGIYAVAE